MRSFLYRLKQVYNVCLTGHNKAGCAGWHKVQAKSGVSQCDLPIRQYVKLPFHHSLSSAIGDLFENGPLNYQGVLISLLIIYYLL